MSCCGKKEEEEEEFPEPEPLDETKIKFAKIMIDDYHAINHTPIDIAFPWLCCCIRPCRKYYQDEEAKDQAKKDADQLKEQLLTMNKGDIQKQMKQYKRYQHMRKKQAANQAEFAGDKDPYLSLGYGMLAYRKIYWHLILAFAFMTACMVPVMKSYLSGTGIAPEDLYKYEDWTIANLGYSTVQCTNIPFGLEMAILQCPYGEIKSINKELGIGLNSGAVENNENKEACWVDSKFDNEVCTGFVDKDKVYGIIETDCIGKKQCKLSLNIDFQNDDFSKSFINKPTEGNEGCADKSAQFFVQYTCEQSEDQLYHKYNKLALITTCILFVAFFFILLVQYMTQNGKIDVKKYDLRTITASDFTVELDITEANWNLFMEEFEADGKHQADEIGEDMSRCLYFKKYLYEKVEEMVGQTMRKIQERNEDYSVNSKIIDIQFAYNNHKLISKLQQRGTAITNLDFKNLNKIDKEIEAIIKNEDMYESLTRPVCAFITFESDDAYTAALTFKKTMFGHKQAEGCENLTLFNEPPHFISATEPTNIIWENRHIKGINFGARVFGASLISIFMLAVAFVGIFLFKRQALLVKQRLPDVNCESFLEEYGDENLIKYASYEYFNNIANDYKAPAVGALQCFCEKESKSFKATDTKKYYNTKKYDVQDLDGVSQQTQMCKKYSEVKYGIKANDQVLKFGIIIINQIIRRVVIKIIQSVGCSTESTQLRYITEAVFLCQFFNTAFLILLIDANLEGQFPILKKIFRGHTTDFNADWFQSMGNTLIGSMRFNVWFPIANEMLWFSIRTLKRILDKCRAKEGSPTKSVTMQQYCNIFAGPNFFLHFKYSSILNTMFICMMYGAGMPQLFPLALITYCVVYFIEKYMLYYVYKSPPAYDEYLSEAVLGRMKIAPLFLLGFGYWMLTNKQILSNDYLEHIERKTDAFNSQHYWYEAMTPQGLFNNGPGGILGFFFWAYFFYIVFNKFIGVHIRKHFSKYLVDDIKINEDIEVYQKCLDADDRTWTLQEEFLMRDYGIQTTWNSMRDKIRDNRLKGPENHLVGIHSYDILRNQSYIDQFQYVSADTPDRADYIIEPHEDQENPNESTAQSDLVRICLNLGFMTKAEVQDLDFTPDALNRLKADVEISKDEFTYHEKEENDEDEED